MRAHVVSAHHTRGNALVMTACFLFLLLGFAALSIDMGNVYVHRQHLQEAADAAALGAVQTWAVTSEAAGTVNVGTKIASNNFLRPSEIVSITPGTWNASTRTFTPHVSHFGYNAVPAVRILARREVPTYFAKLLGFPTISTQARAIAIAGRATAATGILPWATCQTGGQTPDPCETVVLKYSSLGGGNPCSGSKSEFGALSLGGPGAASYRDNIEHGYPGTIRIGDVIPTETGDMVGPTRQGLEARLEGAPPYNCDPANPLVSPHPRLAIVAVTTPAAGTAKGHVVVTDFWVMALDDPAGGQVTVKYLQVFCRQEIDPSRPPGTNLGAVTFVN